MISWIEDWQTAKARAVETARPIYLFLYSPT